MTWLVFVLFFVSGACGLFYEVVWSRMLTLIFGRGALAVGTVLAAFMAGLALGSYLLGKFADRSRNPLRLYSYCEMGVGLTAFIASLFLSQITPLYVWAHAAFGASPLAFALVRFLIVFSILTVPTVLMGATLPILSRFVILRLSRVGRELGRLYAINTVGAVMGSFAAGFYFIGRLGLHGTVYMAVVGNLVVGILSYLLSRRYGWTDLAAGETAPDATQGTAAFPAPADAGSVLTSRIVLWAFALSGFTSFAYEVFWTRSLVIMLGNTTYAFSLMLMAFLSGIALGGYGIRFLVDKVRKPLLLFAAIEVLIGLLSAASLPLLFLIVKSETVVSFISRMSGRLGFLFFSNFGVALVLMLLPATLIGATLPLVSRIFVSDLRNTGTTIGKVYAVNTLGNVFGALVPGLLILPLFGIQKGILLMAGLNIALGVVLAVSRRKHAFALVSSAACAFLLFALLLPRMMITFQFPSESETAKDGVLFYKEGGLVTTKVWAGADTSYKLISVDGVNIGGTSDCDYKQQILAHLPKLLLKSYRSELSVGLGSGILIGESARHSALKRIVCVEISRGVVEGARYFSRENFDIMDDPRAHIVIDDAADFLRTTKERFDIISADEKTAGRYASNSFSYSREYYKLLRQRLAPGGLVIQWMPTELPSSQYTLVLRTFLDSFPHVMLWYFPAVGRFSLPNTFLVGSVERIDIDPVWMRGVMQADADAFAGIRKYGLTEAEDVLAHFVAGEDTLRRAVPPGPVNSFEKPYYEFYSPREYSVPPLERTLVNHELLMSMIGPDFDRFVRKAVDGPDDDHLTAAFHAEEIYLKGYELQLRGWEPAVVFQYYQQAVKTAPWDDDLRNEVVSYLDDMFRGHYANGDYSGAVALLKEATDIAPGSAEVHDDYGRMLSFMKETDSAVGELQRALTLNPALVPARRELGLIYASRGRIGEAMAEWKKVLSVDPYDVKTLVFYGISLAAEGFRSGSVSLLKRAYQLAPKNPEVIDGYARGMYLAGDVATAKRIVLKGGRYYEGHPAFKEFRERLLASG
jgi:spermidine synthase